MTNLYILGIRGGGYLWVSAEIRKPMGQRIIHQKSKQTEGGAGYSTQPVHGVRLTKLIKLSSDCLGLIKSQSESVSEAVGHQSLSSLSSSVYLVE